MLSDQRERKSEFERVHTFACNKGGKHTDSGNCLVNAHSTSLGVSRKPKSKLLSLVLPLPSHPGL